jgi:hypothetical protein
MSAASSPQFKGQRVLSTEGERTLWRTFRGCPLVGGDEFSIPSRGPDGLGYCWSIFLAESGKFVVLRRTKIAGPGMSSLISPT